MCVWILSLWVVRWIPAGQTEARLGILGGKKANWSPRGFLRDASSPFARGRARSARPCKYERKRLRSAAEFRAVSWQVTKRRLSTTKAVEPAGVRGIKTEKWIQQQRLESVQLSDQTSESLSAASCTDPVSSSARLTVDAWRGMKRSG